jgi:hypothetical protein
VAGIVAITSPRLGRPAAERNGTGIPPRQNVLDLGFHAVPTGPAEVFRHALRNQWRNIGHLTDVSDMQVAEIFLLQEVSGGWYRARGLARGQPVQVTSAAPESVHTG